MAKSKYQPTKQELLDAGLNIWALELISESFLRREGMAKMAGVELEFFFPIARSDCADFCGVNIVLEAVPK